MSSSGAQSPKHPLDQDEDLRPFKKVIVEEAIFKDITTRTESSNTILENSTYQRRQRIGKAVDSSRGKKGMMDQIGRDWAGKAAIAQKGMDNFRGNLCYRLSLLQALLHQTIFVDLLLQFHLPQDCVSDSTDRCVACCLRLLMLEYWNGSKVMLTAQSGILKVLQGMDTLFSSLGWAADVSHGHADPEDHMTWIVRTLQLELPSSIRQCLDGILLPIFSTVVTCPCGFESRTNGHQELPLAVDIYPALDQGTLAKYLKRYMVQRLHYYRCDGCGDNRLVKQRKQLITLAPEVICVQLKRVHPITGRKMLDHVHVDRLLNLDAYRDAAIGEELNYELNAVVKHSGGQYSGHYISFAKGPDGLWIRYDDSRKVTSNLATAVSSNGGFTPYLMFYQRK